MLKRGISGVVTAVLLILLVLAAVVIVWTFVKPLIKETGEDSSAECFLINVKPQKCIIDEFDKEIVNVTVLRNAEGGDITGLKFLFNNAEKSIDYDSSLVLVNNGTIPGVLELRTYRVNTTITTDINYFNVVSLVGPDKKICEPIPKRIRCLDEDISSFSS